MTLGRVDKTGTGEDNARLDDRPCMLALNYVGGHAVPGEWRQGLGDPNTPPNWLDVDITDPDHRTANAYNGQPWATTRAYQVTTSRYYIYFQMPTPSVDIDTVAIKLGKVFDPTDVNLELADNPTFINNPPFTNARTAATWSSLDAFDRVASLTLAWDGGEPNVRYTGVEYARLNIRNTNAQIEPPEIAEFFLGVRRQLASRFEIPYDEEPVGLDASHHTSRGHHRVRYPLAKGYRDIDGTLITSSQGSMVYAGLNDLNTMRDAFDENQFGTQPVAYWERPADDVDRFLIGYMQPELEAPQSNACVHSIDWSFEEQPPFYYPESL